MSLLPSTCFVNNKLLTFVSGFRNYAAEALQGQNQERKPDGDITISCFPKIMDNIDIIEEFARIFAEDYWDKTTLAVRRNIKSITDHAVEYIGKMYPVLYADEFQWSEVNRTDSACADKDLEAKRKELIQAALRFDTGKKQQKPIE